MRRSIFVCGAQIFLTHGSRPRDIHKTLIVVPGMRQQSATPASSLPSLMMPCPVCAGRMVYHGRRPLGPGFEDTVYACRRCGAELVRTAMCAAPRPDNGGKPPAQAA